MVGVDEVFLGYLLKDVESDFLGDGSIDNFPDEPIEISRFSDDILQKLSEQFKMEDGVLRVTTQVHIELIHWDVYHVLDVVFG